MSYPITRLLMCGKDHCTLWLLLLGWLNLGCRLCCEELHTSCLQLSDDQLLNSFLHHITFSNKQIRIQCDKVASIQSADDLSTEQLRTSAILFCLSKVTSRKRIQEYFMKLLQVRERKSNWCPQIKLINQPVTSYLFSNYSLTLTVRGR
jgi:hypothetical protein